MPLPKSDRVDLRSRYTILVQIGLIAALLLLVSLFSVEFQAEPSFQVIENEPELIHPVDIEPTEHIMKPPPPEPPAPIEVPEEEVADDIDIEIENTFDPTEPIALPSLPPPADEPEPEPEEPEIFVIVENPPELIGGLEGLQQRIQYPELARRAGIEGTVFVQFVVDEQGNVQDPVCVRDPGGQTCEEALRAVRTSKFKPGRQRGQPVKVRFSLPVKFTLQ